MIFLWDMLVQCSALRSHNPRLLGSLSTLGGYPHRCCWWHCSDNWSLSDTTFCFHKTIWVSQINGVQPSPLLSEFRSCFQLCILPNYVFFFFLMLLCRHVLLNVTVMGNFWKPSALQTWISVSNTSFLCAQCASLIKCSQFKSGLWKMI